MPISGTAGPLTAEIFEQALAQRLLTERHEAALQQQEFENRIRLRELESDEADRELRIEDRRRQIERQELGDLTRRNIADILGAGNLSPDQMQEEIGRFALAGGIDTPQSARDVVTNYRTRHKRTQQAPIVSQLSPWARRAYESGQSLEDITENQDRGVFETPDETKTREQQEFTTKLAQERQLSEMRAGVTAAHREPDAPSIWMSKEGQERFVTPREAAQMVGQGWTRSETPGGVGRVRANITDALGDLANMRAALDRIKDVSLGEADPTTGERSGGVNQQEGMAARFWGGVGWLKQQFGMNTEAYRLDVTTQGRLSQFARALGEKGVLSNYDVQRVETMLPKQWSTRAEAQVAAEELDRIFTGGMDRLKEMARSQGIEVPDFDRPQQTPPPGQGTPGAAPTTPAAPAPNKPGGPAGGGSSGYDRYLRRRGGG